MGRWWVLMSPRAGETCIDANECCRPLQGTCELSYGVAAVAHFRGSVMEYAAAVAPFAETERRMHRCGEHPSHGATKVSLEQTGITHMLLPA